MKEQEISKVEVEEILEEAIYVEQTVGYEIKGNEDKVCKLKKELYELKYILKA